MLSSHLMKFRAYHIVTYSPYLHVEHSIPTILTIAILTHSASILSNMSNHVSPLACNSFLTNWVSVAISPYYFSQWFKSQSSLLFVDLVILPIFGQVGSPGKLNALKDFWFTFDLFLAILIIVETWVTPTVLLLAGWTWGERQIRLEKVFLSSKRWWQKEREQKNEKGEVWFWKKKFNVFNQAC